MPAKKIITKKVESFDSSSEEDIPLKVNSKTVVKKTKKFSSSEDSSSEERTPPVRVKIPVTKTPVTKSSRKTPVKRVSSDFSSEEDTPPQKTRQNKQKKNMSESSSEEESPQVKKTTSKLISKPVRKASRRNVNKEGLFILPEQILKLVTKFLSPKEIVSLATSSVGTQLVLRFPQDLSSIEMSTDMLEEYFSEDKWNIEKLHLVLVNQRNVDMPDNICLTLKELHIEYRPEYNYDYPILELSVLTECVNLTKLVIDIGLGDEDVTFIPEKIKHDYFGYIGACAKLISLELLGCRNLLFLSFLRDLSLLQELYISSAAIINIDDIQECTKLRKLTLGVCENLNDITGIASCKNVKTLNIYRCRELRTLVSLNSLTKLEDLSFDVENLNPHRHLNLAEFKKLTTLMIYNCNDLTWFPKLISVTHLTLRGDEGRHKIFSLAGISNFPNLTYLGLYRTPFPRNSGLEELKHCPHITELELFYCDYLSSLQGVEYLPELKKISIKFTNSIRDMTQLLELPKLKFIEILLLSSDYGHIFGKALVRKGWKKNGDDYTRE